MKYLPLLVWISFCLAFVSAQPIANPGDPDDAFGAGGRVVVNKGLSQEMIRKVLPLPDGKTLAVGSRGNGQTSDIVVLRLLPNGALDPAFGTDGMATANVGGYDVGESLALQPDGKIVAAGYVVEDTFDASGNWVSSNYDVILARFNADGTADQSFGSGGTVRRDLGREDLARRVAVMADGKILVAGHSNRLGVNDFFMIRFSPAGAVDSAFGTGGIVSTDLSGSDVLNDMEVLSDGRILLAGTVAGTIGRYGMARYQAGGALDTTFGTAGKVVTTVSATSPNYCYGIAVQGDGKIVLSGSSANEPYPAFTLVRYSADGVPDASFGSAGISKTIMGTAASHATGVAVQEDGKIVAAGYTHSGLGSRDFAVARFLANGALDTTFGSGGKVTTDFNSTWDLCHDVAIQADGNIVLAGGAGPDFAFARYVGEAVELAAPRISIRGPTGTALATNGTVDLGNAGIGIGREHTFTVENTGSLDLAGINVTKSGAQAADFTLVTPPAATVAPGASTTFTVRFNPGDRGQRGALLSITSNDPEPLPFNIGLAGNGGYAPSITSQPPARQVYEDRTATLEVAAAGDGPLDYHWYEGLPPSTARLAATGLDAFGIVVPDSTTFWVRITNAFGQTDSQAAIVTTLPRTPVFTSPATAGGNAEMPFSYQAAATWGPVTYSAANLPEWLAFSPGGLLGGTPPAGGTWTVELGAANDRRTGTGTVVITILPKPPVITSPLAATGRRNVAFSYQAAATESPASYTAGGLPAGLSINATTGLISGAPLVDGNFSVALQATNAGGTGRADLSLTILPPLPLPAITSSAAASATAHMPFSFQASASHEPLAYEIRNGPAWLSLDAATGLLTGTPIVPGSATVEIRATNTTGPGGWQTLYIAIAHHPDAPVITSAHTVEGRKGEAFSHQLAAVPAAASFLVTGTLPAGIALNGATGLLSGTPTVQGSFTVEVAGTGSVGHGPSSPLTFTLAPAYETPVITSHPQPVEIHEDATALLAVTATGQGISHYQWYRGPVGDTSQPVGGNSASLTTPALVETTGFWVRVSTPFRHADSRGAVVIVLPRVPVFTSPAAASGTRGGYFSFQLAATFGPHTFTATDLPWWASLDAATGLISGFPDYLGTTVATVTAANDRRSSQASLTITISPPKPEITSAVSAEGRQGQPFVHQISATENPAAYGATGLPAGLALNAATGLVTGTPTVAGDFPVTVSATNEAGATQRITTFRIHPPLPPPVITSPAFAAGTVNTSFSFTLQASNQPQSFLIQNRPAWLSLDAATGVLSGTPTHPGPVMVQVAAANTTGPGAWATLSLAVSPHPDAPVITSLAEARGRKGEPFSFQLASSPVAASYALSGSLPAGISFTAAGAFSGTPTVEGTFDAMITPVNANGPGLARALRIVLLPPRQVPVITGISPMVTNVGGPYSGTATASNGPTSFTFVTLPAGLSQTGASGQITGTLNIPGSYVISVSATNADGTGPTVNTVLTVRYHPQSPVIAQVPVPEAYVGIPFTWKIPASSPVGSFTAQDLPPGLALDPATGLIGGTPTREGTFPVILQGSNPYGAGRLHLVDIKVSANPGTPRIMGSMAEETDALVAYTYAIQAQSQIPITGYMSTGLPEGLTLNPATGAITGMARKAGVFEVALRASNAVGTGAEAVLALRVRAGNLMPKITSSASFSGQYGVPLTYQITATNPPHTAFLAAGLPDGLTLEATTGMISGRPVRAGTWQVSLKAANAYGEGDEMKLQLQIRPDAATPLLINPHVIYVSRGQPLNYRFEALGMPSERPWPAGIGIYSDNLPAGMAINPSTGVLSGEPASLAGFEKSAYYHYRGVTFYLVNSAGQSAMHVVYLRYHPEAGERPVVTGPLQLSLNATAVSNFDITANVPCDSYGFHMESFWSGMRSVSGSRASLRLNVPGRFPYQLSATKGGVTGITEASLPLTVAPVAGAPVVTTPDVVRLTTGPVSYRLSATGSPLNFSVLRSSAWPSGLFLDEATGVISGNVTQPASFIFDCAASRGVTYSLPKTITLIFSPPSGSPSAASIVPVVKTRGAAGLSGPVTGKVGADFHHAFEGGGGTDRYRISGLPQGLAYNENTGEISGRPERPGKAEVTVVPLVGNVGGRPLVLEFLIAPADGTPVMGGGMATGAVAGTPLTWQFAAGGEPAGYLIEELPWWLTLDPITGILSGTPEKPGEIRLKVAAYNAAGEGAPREFVITAAAAEGTPVMDPPPGDLLAKVGEEFEVTLTATGGPQFFDATALPFGISLDALTGKLSGTPIEPGTHDLQFWGVNARGLGSRLGVRLIISPADGTPVFSGGRILRALAGKPFSHTFGVSPAADAITLSGAPEGWTFDPASGLLGAIPEAGVYTLHAEAWNDRGTSGRQEFVIRVLADPGSLWVDEYFGDGVADPEAAAWTADPDGDGIPNLVEYAFNLHPGQGSAGAMPSGGTSGLPLCSTFMVDGRPRLRIEYLRRKAAAGPGVIYVPQFSSDLAPSPDQWSTLAGSETVTSIDAGWERVVVEDVTGGFPIRFARIRIVRE